MLTSSLKPNPFRFLLYVEWLMLGSCASVALVEGFQSHSIPIKHILVLVLLGLMGIRLPNSSQWAKIAYTIAELSLIFLGAALGHLHLLPTLYMIVVIRSCFLFRSSGLWLTIGIILILFSIDRIRYLNRMLMFEIQDAMDFSIRSLGDLLVFALATYFVVQLVNTLFHERQMRQQLIETHAQLQQYAARVEDFAAVQERNRIARDIHDSLGHALTSLNVQLQTAIRLWQRDPGQAKPFLLRAQSLGSSAIKEVRHSVGTLRVDSEDCQSLNDRINVLVSDFSRGTGLIFDVDIDDCVDLSKLVTNTLFRLVQESLTNISKHANATKVTIEVDVTYDIVHLTITDDGRGFDMNEPRNGFGLQSMKERIAILHGCLFFKTNPNEGCAIYISIPLE